MGGKLGVHMAETVGGRTPCESIAVLGRALRYAAVRSVFATSSTIQAVSGGSGTAFSLGGDAVMEGSLSRGNSLPPSPPVSTAAVDQLELKLAVLSTQVCLLLWHRPHASQVDALSLQLTEGLARISKALAETRTPA